MGGRERVGPDPDEVVVWEGRPGNPWAVTQLDAYGLLVGSMTAIVAVGLIRQGRLLWLSVPLLLVGLGASVVHYPLVAWRRRRTTYVLTLDHAYVTTAGPLPRTTVVDLRRVGPSHLHRHLDGSQTITFGPEPKQASSWEPVRRRRPAFHSIADADALMPVIRGEAEELDVAPRRRPTD